jgi:transcriptional regulator with XRE-family HTH domain
MFAHRKTAVTEVHHQMKGHLEQAVAIRLAELDIDETELAERMGTTRRRVADILSPRRELSLKTIAELAVALELTPNNLYGRLLKVS